MSGQLRAGGTSSAHGSAVASSSRHAASVAVRTVALCGGVGGAKLALGLSRVQCGPELAVCVNTGDDFEHFGLSICPDLDTVLYTLSGHANATQGWGRASESWIVLEELRRIGAETWFALGDLDLALHLVRTQRLRSGAALSEVTGELAARFGLACRLWPMSDDPVRTIVATPHGPLAFQDYFVRERCAPRVLALQFDGATRARALPALLEALAAPQLRAVIICPSNPWLSIDPMLAIPALRDALARARAPIVAVSPLIAGQAVKGPTAKIMGELGLRVDNCAVAAHYRGLIDGLVVDAADAADAATLDLPTLVRPTRMISLEDRDELARATLDFAESLRGRVQRLVS